MPDDVTFDRRSDADWDESLDLMVAVFGDTPSDTPREWFEVGIGDPPWAERFGFVARSGGRIVSHAEAIDMPIRFDDSIVHRGGIGGVVTLPERQGRGLATALMERTAAEMTRRGWPLGVLLTGSHGFYERLGWCRWTPPGRTLEWSAAADLAAALPDEDGCAVAPYADADFPEMAALYDRYNAGRPGSPVRPEPYWRTIVTRWLHVKEYPDEYSAIHTVRRDGRLVAYGFSKAEDDALHLCEMAYDEGAAVPPLLRAMIRDAGDRPAPCLIATVPWDSDALHWIDSTGRSAPNTVDTIMWRINDLAGLLRTMRPVLASRLAGRDPVGCVISFDRMAVAVEAHSDAVRVAELAPGTSPAAATDLPICSFSQADLVTLVLGSYESTKWLDGLAIPGEVRGLIESLFPPAGGIFWLTDNF